MPLDDCCFRCRDCGNVRCYEDGDRGCIHGEPVCDRCYPGDCPQCQEEAEERIVADLRAAFDAFDGDPFRNHEAPVDADPWGPLVAEGQARNDRFWRGWKGRAPGGGAA